MVNKDATTTTGIFLTLDIELLKKIDEAAKFYHIKRNELLRRWASDGVRCYVDNQKKA
jgi:hypothetical protein